MTTYILCGGSDRKYEKFGANLAKEITKIVPSPQFLDVFFMCPEDVWESHFAEWTKFYSKYFKEYSQEMATFENFYEQIKNADVVFLHGGRTTLLLEKLPDFEKVKKAIRGKIYVGSSAGSNYLAKHFLGRERIQAGSGILPINVAIHYESDDEIDVRSKEDADKLERKFPNVKTYRIREGGFEIFQEEM